MTGDHNCGEVAYEDHSLFLSRPRHRDAVCGRVVDDEDVKTVIPTGTHSLAWYFGLARE